MAKKDDDITEKIWRKYSDKMKAKWDELQKQPDEIESYWLEEFDTRQANIHDYLQAAISGKHPEPPSFDAGDWSIMESALEYAGRYFDCARRLEWMEARKKLAEECFNKEQDLSPACRYKFSVAIAADVPRKLKRGNHPRMDVDGGQMHREFIWLTAGTYYETIGDEPPDAVIAKYKGIAPSLKSGMAIEIIAEAWGYVTKKDKGVCRMAKIDNCRKKIEKYKVKPAAHGKDSIQDTELTFRTLKP